METREELLQKLGDAVNVLGKYADASGRLNNIRAQYRRPRTVKKFGLISKIIMTITVLLSFGSYMISRPYTASSTIMIWIIWVAFVYAVLKFINVSKNRGITKNNEQIEAKNQWLEEQERQVVQEVQQIQAVYNERIAPWYPENYSYLDAAQFFYNSVNNYRADSMKELINLYETTLHQQRVENNQQKAIKEQRIGNFIGVIGAAGSWTTADAVNRQTDDMNWNARHPW